jgi:hypothetical protein
LRRERPRRCRAAEKGDELAPPHLVPPQEPQGLRHALQNIAHQGEDRSSPLSKINPCLACCDAHRGSVLGQKPKLPHRNSNGRFHRKEQT